MIGSPNRQPPQKNGKDIREPPFPSEVFFLSFFFLFKEKELLTRISRLRRPRPPSNKPPPSLPRLRRSRFTWRLRPTTTTTATDPGGGDLTPDDAGAAAAVTDQRGMPAITRVSRLRILTHPTTIARVAGLGTIVAASAGEAGVGDTTTAVVAGLDGLRGTRAVRGLEGRSIAWLTRLRVDEAGVVGRGPGEAACHGFLFLGG